MKTNKTIRVETALLSELRSQLASLEATARNDEMKGAARPRERAVIEAEFQLAKAKVMETLAILEGID